MIEKKSYRWENVNEQLLKQYEFYESRGFSTETEKAYIKRVPLYRYSEVIVLEARLIAYLDGTVIVDVLDTGFHGYYAPWYCEENTERFTILDEVNKRLKKILKKYGIKEIIKKDGSKNKEIN